MNSFLELVDDYFLYFKRYKKNQKFYSALQDGSGGLAIQNLQRVTLICIHSLDWGGAERFAIECIKYLHNKGVDYHIFAEKRCENIGEFLPFLINDNITFANKYQASEEQLLSLVSNLKPSIMHIHHSFSAYKALSRLPRSIYVIDSLHIVEYQTGGYPYLSAKNHQYIQMHHITNLGLLNIMHNQLGVPNYRMKLGYLVDRSLELQAKSRSLQKNHLSIGFLGRFERQKRPELFIECASYILKKIKNIDFNFIMQGEGSLKQKCINMAITKKISNNLVFNDAKEKIDDFHEAVDIILNVSENEGLALTALESAKKRTIYISTNVGQQSEIVASDCLISSDPRKIKKETLAIIQKILSNNLLVNDILDEQSNKYEKCVSNSAREMILDWIYE